MKKLLLSAAIVATSVAATAQIADGSAAPNFTATDINGNSYTLSDYLAAGKTVIIDVSATWCGPCWAYHNTHALRDLYNAYGPNGSDEVMVFFVEGDASTTLADLNGTGSNTTGNWVEGTPYPILDNAGIGSAYQISYFPTIFRICPDGMGGGTVYEQGQSSFSALVSSIGTNCGQTLSGISNHVQMEGGEVVSCSTTGAPEVKFKNFGNNAITSATAVLYENGTQVASQTFSGNVAPLAEGTVTFSSLTLNSGATYTAELTLVNAVAPANPTLATADVNVDISSVVSGTLAASVHIVTDRYGAETTWTLKNSAGTTIASGGPYANLTANGTTVQPVVNVTLVQDECYTMTVNDSYGDGMNSGYGVGSFAVKNAGNVSFISGGTFTSVAKESAKGTNSQASLVENTIAGVNIFPNPATDVLNVTFDANDANYSITMTDLSGRVIAKNAVSGVSGTQNVSFDVTNIAKGSYIVTISSSTGVYTDNVVIK